MILVKKRKLVRTEIGKQYSTNSQATANNASNAEQMIRDLKKHTNKVKDVIFKEVPTSEGIVTVIYSQPLIEKMVLQVMILMPLANYVHQIHQVAEKLDITDLEGATTKILSGHTVMFFKDSNLLLSVDTYTPPVRAVTTSESETTIIGPQDALSESLETNVSLVKRRIKNDNLKNEGRTIGSETKTAISIMYMDDIVNKEDLDLLKSRLDKLNDPSYYDISVLSQQLEDNPLSPFPQYYLTVRPDTISYFLLDGRVVVLMDNSQEAIVCPTSFFEMFTSMEDYYYKWTTATLLRILRFFGFFLTIIITPTYISTMSFQQEILPYELLLNLQESRAKVPFPPLIEVLIIELLIEVLREAGSRMPAKIGQTLGIVGGIVIGTAAVEAGLISNILIVLVAASALLSFLSPTILMSNTSRLVRYIFIFSAGLFGLYGQMLAFAWLIAHLLRIESLGTAYVAPVIPRKATDLLNSVIRFPKAFLKEKMGISRSTKK